MADEDLTILEFDVGGSTEIHLWIRANEDDAFIVRYGTMTIHRFKDVDTTIAAANEFRWIWRSCRGDEHEQLFGVNRTCTQECQHRNVKCRFHLWNIGRYLFGICRMINAIDVAYAPPTW